MSVPVRRIQPILGRSAAPFVARIPGSKSYTHRALLLAAMRPGTTSVHGGLDCDDTRLLATALDAFGGLTVVATPTGFSVTRTAAVLTAPTAPLDLGAAGAPARFLLAFAALADGVTTITGGPRLRERPIADLLQTLRAIGIRCDCPGQPEHLPVHVHGGPTNCRHWRVHAGASSQFTSALLLLASQQPGAPIVLELDGDQVSRPYVEMTRSLLNDCGLRSERPDQRTIAIWPGTPKCDRIDVEVDATSMSYFLALAAITGTTVVIPGIDAASQQGDVAFATALAAMGCDVTFESGQLRLRGGPLRGIDLDLLAMPDVALTLAVVAAHARGSTRLGRLASLRHKECDRLHAVATELGRLGQRVEAGSDWLAIHPGAPFVSARVQTYDDHRVAMAFAVLGSRPPGLEIEAPDCVRKSFPGFWAEFERFGRHHHDGTDGNGALCPA